MRLHTFSNSVAELHYFDEALVSGKIFYGAGAASRCGSGSTKMMRLKHRLRLRNTGCGVRTARSRTIFLAAAGAASFFHQ
jgi:hypothetical protein